MYQFNADSDLTAVLSLWFLVKVPEHTMASHHPSWACKPSSYPGKISVWVGAGCPPPKVHQSASGDTQAKARPLLLKEPPDVCGARLGAWVPKVHLKVIWELGKVRSQGVTGMGTVEFTGLMQIQFGHQL